MHTLTKKQQAVLDYLVEHVHENGLRVISAQAYSQPSLVAVFGDSR